MAYLRASTIWLGLVAAATAHSSFGIKGEPGCTADVCADAEDKSASVSLLQKAFHMAAEVNNHRHQEQKQGVGSKILILGDSNGDFAGGGEFSPQPINTLQVACGGSTVINKAVGGTTISWWMQNNATQLTSAVTSGSGWTHVWLSIGGNDLSIAHQCGPSGSGKNAFKANLQGMISKIKTLTPAQVVLTGYAVTAADDVCSLQEMRENVDAGMREVAAADPRVTFASMAPAAGGLFDPAARAAAKCFDGLLGSETTNPQLKPLIGVPPCRGKRSFFEPDLIHLNAQGYASAWALPAIQGAFNCQASSAPVAPVTAAPTPVPVVTPAPSPVVPAPSPPAVPTPAPVAGCTDNNAGMTTYASGLGYTIPAPGGCAGVAEFCTDATYGATVASYCKATCKVGSCR